MRHDAAYLLHKVFQFRRVQLGHARQDFVQAQILSIDFDFGCVVHETKIILTQQYLEERHDFCLKFIIERQFTVTDRQFIKNEQGLALL